MTNQRSSEYNRTYYQKNRERIAAQRRAFACNLTADGAEARRVAVNDGQRSRYQARVAAIPKKPKPPLKPLAERRREYYERNKAARNAYYWAWLKQRIENDPNARMYRRVMRWMNSAMYRHKAGKAIADSNTVAQMLGCTWTEFLQHIERQFKPGMTWQNRGQRGWQFDHIKPLSSFDLTDESQLREACHFTNVQPLWAAENARKGARVA